MKKTLLLVFVCAVLFAVAILYTACSDDNLSIVQRSIDLHRDSLSAETWLEVEKNENVKICFDSKVRAWETSLDTKILNDSCLKVQVPTLIGVSPIMVKFSDSDNAYKLNLAVGMKYLDFKNEEVLLGYSDSSEFSIENILSTSISDLFNKKDHKKIVYTSMCDLFKRTDNKRLISVTGSYLIDKYPITNCEIIQSMRDDLSDSILTYKKEKNNSNNRCLEHDTVANEVALLQAMKYANKRSIREGLKPYYFFRSDITLSEKQKVIGYTYNKNDRIWISIDTSSDGYRLLYYDEWMMFARGGDRRNAPWDDSTSFYEYMELRQTSGPVGMFSPNGYGIYDVFGLVKEHVLFEENNKMKRRCEVYYVTSSPKPHKGVIYHPQRFPKTKSVDYLSCFKGGGNLYDNWEKINYGTIDYSSDLGGFRLIRNIGNNAKWTEEKSK